MTQKILILLFISLLPTITADAAWKGPVEVVSGRWGSKPGEFGSTVDDMGRWSPMGFCVTATGFIVVGDHLNSRIQVFKPKGEFHATFGPKNIPKSEYQDGWPVNLKCFSDAIHVAHGAFKQVYNLNGSLRYDWKSVIGGVQKIFTDDSFITMNLPTYYKYSASGQLLKTYSSKPLELGELVKQEEQSDHSYKTIVKFDDVTYKLHTSAVFHEYFRDSLGYLNVLFELDEPRRSRVSKYDIYGNLIASIDTHGTIMLNGDAYIDRDKKNYSILKWTWQSETPRQPPPDIMEVPRFFSVSRASRSIDIDWSEPEQDEKCKIGYEIYRADTPGGPYALIAKPEESGMYRDEATEPGKVYYYKMRAFCGGKYSEFTKELKRRR